MLWKAALVSTNGQSKKSPLYVTNICGRISFIWSKNFFIVAFSLGSLKTVKNPSNSGFGVYSKSSISHEIISLFVIKYPYKYE